jgi:hypothetical protein
VDGGEVNDVDRRTIVTSLGQGVDATGRLAQEAMERVTNAIAEYRALIDELAAERVVAVATSAMRDSENGPDFREYLTEKFGAYEVSVATSTRILDEKGIVTFFPEAEDGNFKPVWRRYQLQPFKPGFARVALATLAPVVPVIIVGGEDANPSLGKVQVKHDLADVPIPQPRQVAHRLPGAHRPREVHLGGDLPRQGPRRSHGAGPPAPHAARAGRAGREARARVLLRDSATAALRLDFSSLRGPAAGDAESAERQGGCSLLVS